LAGGALGISAIPAVTAKGPEEKLIRLQGTHKNPVDGKRVENANRRMHDHIKRSSDDNKALRLHGSGRPSESDITEYILYKGESGPLKRYVSTIPGEKNIEYKAKENGSRTDKVPPHKKEENLKRSVQTGRENAEKEIRKFRNTGGKKTLTSSVLPTTSSSSPVSPDISAGLDGWNSLFVDVDDYGLSPYSRVYNSIGLFDQGQINDTYPVAVKSIPEYIPGSVEYDSDYENKLGRLRHDYDRFNYADSVYDYGPEHIPGDGSSTSVGLAFGPASISFTTSSGQEVDGIRENEREVEWEWDLVGDVIIGGTNNIKFDASSIALVDNPVCGGEDLIRAKAYHETQTLGYNPSTAWVYHYWDLYYSYC
jgi:hypothetical protein